MKPSPVPPTPQAEVPDTVNNVVGRTIVAGHIKYIAGFKTPVQIKPEKRLAFLKANHPFAEAPKMDEVMFCGVCEKLFQVKDYRVMKNKKGEKMIFCATENCDNPIDQWIPKETYDAFANDENN